MEWTENGEKTGEKQVCAKQSLPSSDPDKDWLMERKSWSLNLGGRRDGELMF